MVPPRKLILKSFQSPGDIVMLTAAVRDLHLAHPGSFKTDVRTPAPALWENNPHLTPLQENDSQVQVLDMHYPLVHESNQRPYHFIHGYGPMCWLREGPTPNRKWWDGKSWMPTEGKSAWWVMSRAFPPQGFSAKSH